MATMRGAVVRTARQLRQPALSATTRGMATEKQLAMRIASTKNISKITQSMKMVSASKLRGDQSRLDTAKPFAAWAETLAGGSGIEVEDMDLTPFAKKNLIVCLTSDKGLCGGVNSVITRNVRKLMPRLEAEDKSALIMVVGDKGRAQISRNFPEYITRSLTEVEAPQTFSLAAAITTEALKHDFDKVHIIFNTFKSAIAYDTTIKSLPNLVKATEEPMVEYEFEPDTKDEILEDLNEYMMASQVYHCLMEAATSEQSSRMNAMENASKNAGEMIDSLTLQYNRARQARITTELIEIISGASALEG